MIRLTNTTDQPITAATGHEVPPEGTLDVSDATWDRICREPYIAGQMRRGNLRGELVKDEPEGPTRSDIATAKRAELLGIIAAHSDYTDGDMEGVLVEGRDGEDGLRDIAARLVFGA